jgi:hypothetical protein
LTEVSLKTKASKELALEALSSAIEREIKVLESRLASLEKEKRNFEVTCGMSSEEFYEKFEKGELGDAEEYFSWWGAVRASKSVKERL